MSVKPYMDCPTCPACGSRTGVLAKSFSVKRNGLAVDDVTLFCAVCGWIWIGGVGEVDQAKAAEAAWIGRADGALGPWTTVLKRRARQKTAQVLLLRASGVRS